MYAGRRHAGGVRTFAARCAIAALIAMTSAVALTSTAIGAVRTLGAIGAIAVRTLRTLLGTFRATGGRVGRAVKGAVVAICAVRTRTLSGRIKEGGGRQGFRARRGARLGTGFYARFAWRFASRLRSRWRARGSGGRWRRRNLAFGARRRLSGGVGRYATWGPPAAGSGGLLGRASRRWRRCGIPRRGRRRCIEIRIVVATGIGGRRGTGAAAANGAFAFGHSKTASGTVGSVPIWKGARRRRRHEDMRCNRSNVRCPCRARDARRALIVRVALDGKSRAVTLAGKAVRAFRYRGGARETRASGHKGKVANSRRIPGRPIHLV